MMDTRASGDAKRRAFQKVVGSIDISAGFPAQVFRGNWGAFSFFSSDYLFASDFAAISADLLDVEQAEVCCLLNLSESGSMEYDAAAMLFLDRLTSPQAYDGLLRQGGPAKGWLFGMDRYGCASDRGEWSIYCEKGNDVAAIALRQPEHTKKYAECLRHLNATPIAAAVASGSEAPFPFGQLTKSWRNGLSQNYGERG